MRWVVKGSPNLSPHVEKSTLPGIGAAASFRGLRMLCPVSACKGFEREADLSSAEPEAYQQARVPCAHGDQMGARSALAAPQEGPQAADRPDRVEAPRGLTAERLSRSSRLTRAAEIRALMTQGKRRRTDHLDLFVRPSPVGCSRLAVIVPRHQHTAVLRNKLRRRLREIGRRSVLPGLPEASDVAVRARPAAYDATFETLRREFVGSLCPSLPGSVS